MFQDPKTFVELKPGEYVVSVRPLKIVLWTLALLGAVTLLLAVFGCALSKSLSVGARYKYLWIANSQDFTVLGASVHQDNAAAHLFSATLTYRF